MSPLHHPECFSASYAQARERFLAAAREAGAEVTSYPFDARGIEGEPLFLDAAALGAREAEQLVIISSGLHGVEGFFGSAVQIAWLRGQGREFLRQHPGARMLLLHALNPFGFSHSRRASEGNVDLNRNFLPNREFIQSDPRYLGALRTYRQLSPLLNPPTPPPAREAFLLKLAAAILKVGFHTWRRSRRAGRPFPWPKTLLTLGVTTLRESVPVGQYAEPRGLFYGGSGDEPTTLLLRREFPKWIGPARHVLHLDLHSGLGRWGEYKLLIAAEEGSPLDTFCCAAFGHTHVEPLGGMAQPGATQDKTAYTPWGAMASHLGTLVPGADYRCVSPEFGTYPFPKVLAAMRRENRAHHHLDKTSPRAAKARAVMREVFCPKSGEWREAVLAQGTRLIGQACAAFTRQG